MNCFRHHDRPAIATCRNCGKAACSECCDDTGRVIACSEACISELREDYQLKERMKQSFGIGRKPPMPASIPTYGLFGVILMGVGIYLSYTRPGVDFLTFAMSAVFFVMAAASYKRYRDICLAC